MEAFFPHEEVALVRYVRSIKFGGWSHLISIYKTKNTK